MSNLDKRVDYSKAVLTENAVVTDPFEQFRAWYDVANADGGVIEASAMTLATADGNGVPSARIVLLRGIDHGFVFYTNYESRKGHDLAVNPVAALVFHWAALERQVRVEGTVERVSPEESDAYFTSRPWRSKLGAHVSEQSTVIDGSSVLTDELSHLEQRYPEASDVPRPPHWGGYRVVPTSIELWQGRRSRLHDRLRYTRFGDGWKLERLAP